MEKGKLVVVEGTVGSGKSTLIQNLAVQGVLDEWFVTREPGGTEFGDRMRMAVQDPKLVEVYPYAALFAYAASRANSVNLVVRPRLEKGVNVLSDRWWFSTWAYQGAEGVAKPLIWLVNMIAIRRLQPDLTLFLDVPVEIGIRRKMHGKEKDVDRYDLKTVKFMQKARRNYLQLGRLYPRSWVSIDASRDPEKVVEETMLAMGRMVKGRRFGA